jgi:hypothetical protein
MEDAVDHDDIELEEEENTYSQYDSMSYHDLSTSFDEELTGRLQREAKYGSDPLAFSSINRELDYVKMRMEDQRIAETSFTEGGDGTVNITGPTGSTTVPGVEFAENPGEILPVDPDVMNMYNESFDDSGGRY